MLLPRTPPLCLQPYIPPKLKHIPVHGDLPGRQGGLKGGKARSEAKIAAARLNGIKGGMKNIKYQETRGMTPRERQRFYNKQWLLKKSNENNIRSKTGSEPSNQPQHGAV